MYNLLMVNLVISCLYLRYKGTVRPISKPSHPARDEGPVVIWSDTGTVQPLSFTYYRLIVTVPDDFYQYTPNASRTDRLDVCVSGVGDAADIDVGSKTRPRAGHRPSLDSVGDPDIYVSYSPSLPHYTFEGHDASAASYGLDCVTLEPSIATRRQIYVGVYGYAHALSSASDEVGGIPFRIYVGSWSEGVTVTGLPVADPEGEADSEMGGDDGEEPRDKTRRSGAKVDRNGNEDDIMPPEISKKSPRRRLVRRETVPRKEPALWSILMGFLNVLTEIL